MSPFSHTLSPHTNKRRRRRHAARLREHAARLPRAGVLDREQRHLRQRRALAPRATGRAPPCHPQPRQLPLARRSAPPPRANHPAHISSLPRQQLPDCFICARARACARRCARTCVQVSTHACRCECSEQGNTSEECRQLLYQASQALRPQIAGVCRTRRRAWASGRLAAKVSSRSSTTPHQAPGPCHCRRRTGCPAKTAPITHHEIQ